MQFKRRGKNRLFWFLVYQLQQKKKMMIDINWVNSAYTYFSQLVHWARAQIAPSFKHPFYESYPQYVRCVQETFVPFLPVSVMQMDLSQLGTNWSAAE